ncbi:enoyl-CoA hydratase/isomerase family protein [Limobrevibacterium gyesilva]|uniref:3-hydroxyisobutyryl-CoA hydrolase n=1 Tax=Limobrevibacterium gyesilva TaxID=2991712 RepID=A0AA42CD02_9PROT|nr:enoyl-CoA hydratase/isomerase family protein [Limobrevibacterium gyesilva]MCW3473029.1 enoyl-CoA hydratase/isomerase family protein [Limobrevibacterium gyesilva]
MTEIQTTDMAGVDQSVVATRNGRIGHILLNRPKALNALDTAMIRAMTAALAAWRDDPAVHAVVIEGAGGRAFCAGGDIRAIRTLALAGERAAIEAFFAEEYALNALIDEYPKPYVAVIDGICMGGGIGVSVHGQMRVTSEAGLFAMPETAIAMFPDVGATFMLPRLPGAIGMYLGLTGARLHGADAVHAGIATHFVPKPAIATLAADVAADGVAAVAAHAQTLPPFSLAAQRPAIDRCFGADSVAGIIARLEAEGTDWARETLAALRSVSPSAVLWSFEAIRRGAACSLRDCLSAELALTRHVTAHPDFAEGVRAMVVEKDRQPRWSPSRIEDVDPAAIAAMFA